MNIAIRIIAIILGFLAGPAFAQAPAVQLQVGKTYYMLDGTVHTIVGVTTTRPRVYRSDTASQWGWYANGTPSTALVDKDGSKSLFGPLPPALVGKLRASAPGKPGEKVLIEYDPSARTVRMVP